ncbi:hypothetical protein [Paenibacillus farraposensis]|nr:hypothetical protein [Paenibacillus farraposensis]
MQVVARTGIHPIHIISLLATVLMMETLLTMIQVIQTAHPPAAAVFHVATAHTAAIPRCGSNCGSGGD